MQGGVLSLALLLPASAFPVETSQSSEKEGGLQTTVELFSLLFLFVGFFHSYHAPRRTKTSVLFRKRTEVFVSPPTFLLKKKSRQKKTTNRVINKPSFLLQKGSRQKKTAQGVSIRPSFLLQKGSRQKKTTNRVINKPSFSLEKGSRRKKIILG